MTGLPRLRAAARADLAKARDAAEIGAMATAAPHKITWEPHRETTLKSAKRRARLVGKLRRVFVAGAGAAFASVFVFVAFGAVNETPPPSAVAEPARMLKPRFVGHSESTGAFEVTAESAQRAGAGVIELTSPVYRTEAGAFMAAPRGRYEEASNSVVFEGEVVMSNPGVRLMARSAVVDLDRGAVTARGRVTGAASPPSQRR